MKKAIYISLLVLLSASYSAAQNIDDALRFNKRELTGTSRSLGMANAFGALGGDLSSLSINPAGIAVYRSSDFAFTPSISVNQATAQYGGLTSKDDKYAFPLNQIGFVFTNKPMREKETGLISTHYGFTYNRTADFNSTTNMRLNDNAMDDYEINGYTANTLLGNIMLDANGYYDDELSGRSRFAFDSYLIDTLFYGSTEYFNHYEAIEENGEGEYDIFHRNTNGVAQRNIVERNGYNGEYAFTFGANVSNVLLLGVSLNFQTFRHEQKEIFREINRNSFDPADALDMDYYDLYSNLKQKGTGVNAKLGMILNLHPLRLGASFHAPTFYNIKDEYYIGMETFYLDRERFHYKSSIDDFSYSYRTPYRAQGSAALVLGKFALLSFDYEMTDHTSSKFTSNKYSTTFEDINESIDEQFKITHDFKAGIEIRPLPYLALRGGAAYFDSPIKNEYVDVELVKWMGTAGLGIKNKNFYFDIAYAYKINDDNYYINTSENSTLYGLSFDEPVEINNKNHQASFTFGWKF